MFIVLGVALLGLTLYIAILAFTLQSYSRARLGDALPGAARERWLTWFDEHDWELQTLTSLLRLVLNLAVPTVLILGYARGGRELQFWPVVEIGLAAIVLLAMFSIAIPHAISVHAGEAVLARSVWLVAGLRALFWPIGRVFRAVEFVVRRLLGKAEHSEAAETERVEQEILEAVSEGEAYGAVDEEKKEMIESVFALDETQVSAIMTPRTEIDAVAADVSFEDVRAKIIGTGHSRIPVYEGSIDHIIGVLYAKDLLKLDRGDPFEAARIMRTAPYVPETKTLDELLEEFRETRVQIAVVLDEYGGTAGLVTLEDILEELVGEIDDEYDQRPPPALNRIDADTLEVDARVRISEINAELDADLPEEEDYETIGGFVFATLGRIPNAGEDFEHENVRVHIVDAEARRIKRLQIRVLNRAEA